MPKFEPKAILSRVLLGKSRQKEGNMDYLCAGLQHYLLGLDSDAYIGRATDNHDDDELDDDSSNCSFSTMATADNLPGTGRTLDMYIYQPAGRCIERLAMRLTIATLHPARITQYLEANDTDLNPGFLKTINLLDSDRRNVSTVVAGMKGLVKQTQSNSINRSACALAALIRVSFVRTRQEIYANVSRIEPIFNLETLAGSLVCLHPDKKWLLLLVKLARESLIAIRVPLVLKLFDPVLGTEVILPSLESAQKLRQRLIRVLDIYKLSGLDSLEDTIGESCAICAEASSTCIDSYSQGDAYVHILETVFFTVIFLLRSIYELADTASITANRHIYMVLRTISCLIDAIVYRCLYDCGVIIFNMDLLRAIIAFRSLVLQVADGDTLLPQSFRHSSSDAPAVDTRTLPRRHRAECTPAIQSLFEVANCRTRRLLRSFNELEREVLGCGSRTNISTSQFKIDTDPNWDSIKEFGYERWDYWKSTLERARRVAVPETILTEEFREARKIGVSRNLVDRRNWCYYQLRHDSRHTWGQYLRSSMDWDWDLATCLKRLFKVEKQIRGGPSRTAPAPSSAIDVAAGPGGTLEISMGDAQEESLPTAVKFAYKTKTGETRYMSFVPEGSGPGCQPDSETASTGPSAEQILGPSDAQQDSGHRKESFGGEQGVENPKTGAFLSDVSLLDACKNTQVEGPNIGCKWTELVYNDVRAGEDTISICSLD